MRKIKYTKGCLKEVEKNINGYLVKCFWEKEDGTLSKVIEITAPHGITFLPEIYADRDYRNGTIHLRIQTTSYGALDKEKFKDFFTAQQRALATIEEIDNFDWDNAIIIDFD